MAHEKCFFGSFQRIDARQYIDIIEVLPPLGGLRARHGVIKECWVIVRLGGRSHTVKQDAFI